VPSHDMVSKARLLVLWFKILIPYRFEHPKRTKAQTARQMATFKLSFLRSNDRTERRGRPEASALATDVVRPRLLQ